IRSAISSHSSSVKSPWVDRQVVAMGLSLDPIIGVYGIRPLEGGLFSRCAGLTSTTASELLRPMNPWFRPRVGVESTSDRRPVWQSGQQLPSPRGPGHWRTHGTGDSRTSPLPRSAGRCGRSWRPSPPNRSDGIHPGGSCEPQQLRTPDSKVCSSPRSDPLPYVAYRPNEVATTGTREAKERKKKTKQSIERRT